MTDKKADQKPQKKQRTHFEEEALRFHMMDGVPGKVALKPTKPLLTQRDLALAYSPGVAAPCEEIVLDPETAYDYTAKGNTVAVISNGTAVLGLGNLGALASKPVMEGKAVLFKRFADIDAVDIEVDTTDIDQFINAVRYLGPTWGGINLEDIAGPECFIIEEKLKELMDIPVFHDDQHGTAIICAAGLLNAAHMSNRKIEDMTVVVNGAGAAGIACLDLMITLGVKKYFLCDRSGIIYEGREGEMNQWKSKYAANTEKRTLLEAMTGADVFLGLSAKGAVTKEMVKSMAPNPVIFAMANPDPEITPEEVLEVRTDAIIATGRSDYPNQVNNVMGFPYIFRGALDVRATKINEEMKLAAAHALAELARTDVPDEVAAAYQGRQMSYGPQYIIPTPFDPRLIYTIPVAVAKAAMETGVAKKPIKDFVAYKKQLQARLNPTANSMNLIYENLVKNPKRVIFAEGEEDRTIRAAAQWINNHYGSAILVGRAKKIKDAAARLNLSYLLKSDKFEITNSALSKKVEDYVEFLYKRLQRNGYLRRDVARMIKTNRNYFAATMLASGDGDTMITGAIRGFEKSLQETMLVLEPQKENSLVFGMSIMLSDKRTLFISDTTQHETPTPEQLADIAVATAAKARQFGHEPRVAMLSYSNFGSAHTKNSDRVREAVKILDSRKVDFEYEGEMNPDVALNPELMNLYPFCRLTAPANVLIMPGLYSASLSSKLLQELSSGVMLGPVMIGLDKPAQIITPTSTVSEIMNAAALSCVGHD